MVLETVVSAGPMTSCEADTDTVSVLTANMRSDLRNRATVFQLSAALDKEVVSDTGPASLTMPAVYFRRRDVVLRARCCAVKDDAANGSHTDTPLSCE